MLRIVVTLAKSSRKSLVNTLMKKLASLFDKKRKKRLRGRASAEWSSIDLYDSEVAILWNILEHSRQICGALNVPDNTTISWADLNDKGLGCASFEKRSNSYRILLDSSVYSKREKGSKYSDILDIYCGISVHEASHVNHSDIKNSEKFLAEIDFYENLFVQLLEDNRIEELAVQEAPGFAQYLDCLETYCINANKLKGVFSDFDDLQKVMVTIFTTIRTPSEVTQEMKDYISPKGVKVFESFVETVKVPVTLEDTFAIGKVLRIWLDTVIDLPKDERLTPQKKLKGEQQEALEDLIKSDEVLDKIVKFIRKHIDEVLEEKVKKEVEELDEDTKIEYFEDDEKGKIKSVVKVAEKFTAEDKRVYMADLSKVRNQVARLRKYFSFRLAEKTYKVNELSEGKLNRRMLSRIPSGYDRLYSQTSTKSASGLSVCLLLDASGSMSGRKVEVARQIAILFTEALMKVPNVELEVYSFTSGGYGESGVSHRDSLMTYLYGKKQPNKEILGSYDAQAENFDGVAIRTAAKTFKNVTTNENRLMIVISDGYPAGPCYGGEVGIEDTKKAVQEVSKEIEILGIGIEEFNINKMYKHSVKWTDLSSLVNNVGGKLRKVVQASTLYK